MREFNTYIKGGRAHLKAFQGATAKWLHHYILPTLKEDNPEIVILHVGYNDLSPKDNDLGNINIESIANEIINIGKTCHQHGVETFVISSIVCNRNYKKQSLIDCLNNVLEEKCKNSGLSFLQHHNIKKEHLWRDGTHLLEHGKVLLARNFIDYLNYFLTQNMIHSRIT